MTLRHALRGSAPAFLAGIALAIGTQVGVGLLLYGGPGLLQALSVILATAAVSLGLGLASGGSGSAEEARRAWLFLLLAFTAAAIFSAGWQLFRGFGARPLTQGLGLALLVALPLYLGGRLLAQLRSPDSGSRAPGPPALVGGAIGLLVLGHLFFPTLSPTAVLLLCVVAVSGGALSHGWLLDEVIREEPLETGEPGLVVRRSRRIRPPLDLLTIEEVPSVRLVRRGDGGPLLPVDVGLEVDLLPSLPVPERVLAFGWRVVPAATRVVPPGAAVALVHAMPEGVRAILASLPGSVRSPEEVEILGAPAAASLFQGAHGLQGAHEAAPGREFHAADWVLVDATELEGLGDQRWSRLRELLRPGGTVVVVGATEMTDSGGRPAADGAAGAAGAAGADGAQGAAGGSPEGGLLVPLRAGAHVFGSAAAYVGPSSMEGAGGAVPAAGREGLLVFAAEPDRAWPDTAGRLLLVLPGED
ncbi:MAG: hypothetical protein EA350_13080 [Gemmatimonadales bacterium]|nr:MAG: hypothetical protein EA350_13080 [Gemmatimonadales bacterium]